MKTKNNTVIQTDNTRHGFILSTAGKINHVTLFRYWDVTCNATTQCELNRFFEKNMEF